MISADDVEAFQRDGAFCLRDVLTPEQVERIALGVCVNVSPGPCSKACAICLEDAVHAAPVVAAMLTEARADEQQRIAQAIESECIGSMDSKPCVSCRGAARIARGEA